MSLVHNALQHPATIIQKKRARPEQSVCESTVKPGPKKSRVVYGTQKHFDVRIIRKDHPQWKIWKDLAQQTMQNTVRVIRELKEELCRMHGGIVYSDHVERIITPASEMWRSYSLNPEQILAEVAAKVEDDSSDTCPSDDED